MIAEIDTIKDSCIDGVSTKIRLLLLKLLRLSVMYFLNMVLGRVSTRQAILELNKDLNDNMNKDDIYWVIFLNITKTFDSLDHTV